MERESTHPVVDSTSKTLDVSELLDLGELGFYNNPFLDPEPIQKVKRRKRRPSNRKNIPDKRSRLEIVEYFLAHGWHQTLSHFKQYRITKKWLHKYKAKFLRGESVQSTQGNRVKYPEIEILLLERIINQIEIDKIFPKVAWISQAVSNLSIQILN